MTRAAAGLGRPPPTRDLRLDRVADDVARATPAGQLPSLDLVSFLLAHYGIVEPEPNLVLVRGAPGAEMAIAEALRKRLPELLLAAPWSRLGVGLARGPGEVAVVLALQEQHVALSPLPRRLPAGGTVKVSGRLLDGFRAPKVIVTAPRGGVRETRPAEARGRFEGLFACAHGDGVYQVEVSGEDQRGPAVLANFPVYCGVEPPRTPPTLVAETLRPQDPDDAERELLTLLNRDRAAAGLAAVRPDRRLAAIARAHSAEMASTGMVAHLSPRTGSAADRVQRAGLRPTLVAENVGRAYSGAQAERGFMTSPGHRANIVDPRVTLVGIGVAAGRQEDAVLPLFFTQLFAAGL